MLDDNIRSKNLSCGTGNELKPNPIGNMNTYVIISREIKKIRVGKLYGTCHVIMYYGLFKSNYLQDIYVGLGFLISLAHACLKQFGIEIK